MRPKKKSLGFNWLNGIINFQSDWTLWWMQAYAHKILTGRRSRMHTIRQTCGLAGFPKREENVHDAFGAGHSSTSISAGLGTTINYFRYVGSILLIW